MVDAIDDLKSAADRPHDDRWIALKGKLADAGYLPTPRKAEREEIDAKELSQYRRDNLTIPERATANTYNVLRSGFDSILEVGAGPLEAAGQLTGIDALRAAAGGIRSIGAINEDKMLAPDGGRLVEPGFGSDVGGAFGSGLGFATGSAALSGLSGAAGTLGKFAGMGKVAGASNIALGSTFAGHAARLGAIVEAQAMFREAEAAGASKADQFAAFFLGGVVGTSEGWAIGGTGRIKRFGETMAKIDARSGGIIAKSIAALPTVLKEGAKEAGQEGFQSFSEKMIAQQIVKYATPEEWDVLLADVGKNALLGGIVGTGFAQLGISMEQVGNRKRGAADMSKLDQESMGALGNVSQGAEQIDPTLDARGEKRTQATAQEAVDKYAQSTGMEKAPAFEELPPEQDFTDEEFKAKYPDHEDLLSILAVIQGSGRTVPPVVLVENGDKGRPAAYQDGVVIIDKAKTGEAAAGLALHELVHGRARAGTQAFSDLVALAQAEFPTVARVAAKMYERDFEKATGNLPFEAIRGPMRDAMLQEEGFAVLAENMPMLINKLMGDAQSYTPEQVREVGGFLERVWEMLRNALSNVGIGKGVTPQKVRAQKIEEVTNLVNGRLLAREDVSLGDLVKVGKAIADLMTGVDTEVLAKPSPATEWTFAAMPEVAATDSATKPDGQTEEKKPAKKAKKADPVSAIESATPSPTVAEMPRTKPDMFGETKERNAKRKEVVEDAGMQGQLIQEDTGQRGQASILDAEFQKDEPKAEAKPKETGPAAAKARRQERARKRLQAKIREVANSADSTFRHWLRAVGGVEDAGGDLSSYTRKNDRSMWKGLPPGFPAAIQPKGSGTSPDMLIRQMWEDGWFGDGYTDVRDLEARLYESEPNPIDTITRFIDENNTRKEMAGEWSAPDVDPQTAQAISNLREAGYPQARIAAIMDDADPLIAPVDAFEGNFPPYGETTPKSGSDETPFAVAPSQDSEEWAAMVAQIDPKLKENGVPITVYHGSGASWTTYDARKNRKPIGRNKKTKHLFATDTPLLAGLYAKDRSDYAATAELEAEKKAFDRQWAKIERLIERHGDGDPRVVKAEAEFNAAYEGFEDRYWEGVTEIGAQVYPLILTASKAIETDAKGKSWGEVMQRIENRLERDPDAGVAIVRNVIDSPSTAEFGEPSTVYIVKPGNAKSIWNKRPTTDPDIRFAVSPTIEVDGQERPRMNSEGRPIARTDEALRAFWRWFQDSRVVDSEGRPLVVYHGTRGDFTAFESMPERRRFPYSRDAFYFGASPIKASIYADGLVNATVKWDPNSKWILPLADGGNVISAYLRVENPKEYMGAPIGAEERVLDANSGGVVDQARADGFDGVFVTNDIDGAIGVAVVFDPTQIKSATGNRGTFDGQDPDIRYAAAYHGSPHEFDRFDLSKIGTGEGAQAYGHGLYFASRREVAKHYRDTLTSISIDGRPLTPRTYGITAIAIKHRDDFAAMREALRGYIEESGANNPYASNGDAQAIIDAIDRGSLSIPQSAGRGYTVELAPTEDEYLLWDATLEDQSETVNKALAKTDWFEYAEDQLNSGSDNPTGADLVHWLERDMDPQEASQTLHDAGIRGTKFLDGASRSKGKGDYNYVLFSDQDVEIVDRWAVAPDPEKGDILIANLGEGFVGKGARAWQKNMTSRGLLPQSAFDAMIEVRDSRVAVANKRIKDAAGDLRRAVKQAQKDGTAKTTIMSDINRALGGTMPMTALPKGVREQTERMRSEIDEFSAAMISSGAVDGKLVAKVAANMGLYLTRSYQAFDDPKWESKIPVEVRNRAVSLLRSRFAQQEAETKRLLRTRADLLEARAQESEVNARTARMPEKHLAKADDYRGKAQRLRERADAFKVDKDPDLEIRALLADARNSGSPYAMLAGGKLGSKDLSILKRRKVIAPEIRALLGEYTDPMVNYARSVSKMAFLVANHEFLKTVRAAGIEEGYFSKKKQGDNIVQIATEESHTLAPLNGLWTSEEVLEAFEDVMAPSKIGPYFQAYLKINATVKVAKTAFSWATQARNIVGGPFFLLAQGHITPQFVGKAFGGFLSSVGWSTDAGRRAYFLDALAYGVVHESASAGELNDIMKDATGVDYLYDPIGARGGLKKVGRAALTLYQSADDFYKLIAWEAEKAGLRKAFPEMSEEEVKREAAKIVRVTNPTYSLVPRLVKQFRKNILTGPFTSFPAEMVRITYNTGKQIKKELKDPRTRSRGYRRLAGSLVVASFAKAAQMATAFLMGYDDEDEDAMREFAPEWAKNGDWLYLERDAEGRPRYIDLSYTDPFSYMKGMVNALFRGEDLVDGVTDSIQEGLGPFFGEELLSGALLDLRANQRNGSRSAEIYNTAEGAWDVGKDVSGYLWNEVFEPGTLTSLRRIEKAMSGEVSRSGKAYNTQDEVVAMLLGQRRSTIDAEQSLLFKALDYSTGISNSNKILSSAASRMGSVDKDELRNSWESMEAARRETFDDLLKSVRAARRLGLTDKVIEDRLRGASISQDQTRALIRGIYEPYDITETFLNFYERGATSERKKELRERRKLVKEIAKENQ